MKSAEQRITNQRQSDNDASFDLWMTLMKQQEQPSCETREVCEACGCGDVFVDDDSGTIVCRMCGVNIRSTYTNISYNQLVTHTFVSHVSRRDMQRERLQNKINAMCEKLCVGELAEQLALELVRSISKRMKLRITDDCVFAVCVALACHRIGNTLTTETIIAALSIGRWAFTRSWRRVSRIYLQHVSPIVAHHVKEQTSRIDNFIRERMPRVFSTFDMACDQTTADAYTNDALILAHNIELLDIASDVRDLSCACACICLVLDMHGIFIQKLRIATAFDVSQSSLFGARKKIGDIRNHLIQDVVPGYTDYRLVVDLMNGDACDAQCNIDRCIANKLAEIYDPMLHELQLAFDF